jgi:hypothetical protein
MFSKNVKLILFIWLPKTESFTLLFGFEIGQFQMLRNNCGINPFRPKLQISVLISE